MTTITKETLLACIARGLRVQDAASELGISKWVIARLNKKLGVSWPQPTRGCKAGHPREIRVVVGGRKRCPICYAAECNKRQRTTADHKRDTAKKAVKGCGVNQQVEEHVYTLKKLAYDKWRETQPKFITNPIPPDPRDVCYRGRP